MYVKIRDYITVLVSARSINQRPNYQPKSFSWRADIGQGLILRAITKLCVIICLSLFQFTVLTRLTYKNVSKTEDWRTLNTLHHSTCLHLTSSNEQRLRTIMINSLPSKYMFSVYHHCRLITNWPERAYRICILWVIVANSVPNMW